MAVSKDNGRVMIKLSKEDKELLERLAEEDNRSVSNYASTILQNHLKKFKERS